jgi:hypothetical protein
MRNASGSFRACLMQRTPASPQDALTGPDIGLQRSTHSGQLQCREVKARTKRCVWRRSLCTCRSFVRAKWLETRWPQSGSSTGNCRGPAGNSSCCGAQKRLSALCSHRTAAQNNGYSRSFEYKVWLQRKAAEGYGDIQCAVTAVTREPWTECVDGRVQSAWCRGPSLNGVRAPLALPRLSRKLQLVNTEKWNIIHKTENRKQTFVRCGSMSGWQRDDNGLACTCQKTHRIPLRNRRWLLSPLPLQHAERLGGGGDGRNCWALRTRRRTP